MMFIERDKKPDLTVYNKSLNNYSGYKDKESYCNVKYSVVLKIIQFCMKIS